MKKYPTFEIPVLWEKDVPMCIRVDNLSRGDTVHIQVQYATGRSPRVFSNSWRKTAGKTGSVAWIWTPKTKALSMTVSLKVFRGSTQIAQHSETVWIVNIMTASCEAVEAAISGVDVRDLPLLLPQDMGGAAGFPYMSEVFGSRIPPNIVASLCQSLHGKDGIYKKGAKDGLRYAWGQVCDGIAVLIYVDRDVHLDVRLQVRGTTVSARQCVASCGDHVLCFFTHGVVEKTAIYLQGQTRFGMVHPDWGVIRLAA